MGAEYEARGAVTAECIQIYKLAWTEPVINFKGRFFEINDVTMDPKPVQDPHPPIWYGGMSKIAAKRAARECDGFYPMFLDAVTTPETLAPLTDEIRREAERVERDLSRFQLGGFCQVRVTEDAEKDPRFKGERPLLTGTAEQIIEDLQHFADHGYSHVTVHLDCPNGTMGEWVEQMERFAAEVLPAAREIQHRQQF
jgi:alkanesulfonate monooxygenase SsuD/methylene tetrahydromethanopterin reductase-like flavin-dependent oxidoreductase (luciferase family)